MEKIDKKNKPKGSENVTTEKAGTFFSNLNKMPFTKATKALALFFALTTGYMSEVKASDTNQQTTSEVDSKYETKAKLEAKVSELLGQIPNDVSEEFYKMMMKTKQDIMKKGGTQIELYEAIIQSAEKIIKSHKKALNP